LAQGEYRLTEVKDAHLRRYQLSLPVAGGYPEIRAFVAQALNADPALALTPSSCAANASKAPTRSATQFHPLSGVRGMNTRQRWLAVRWWPSSWRLSGRPARIPSKWWRAAAAARTAGCFPQASESGVAARPAEPWLPNACRACRPTCSRARPGCRRPALYSTPPPPPKPPALRSNTWDAGRGWSPDVFLMQGEQPIPVKLGRSCRATGGGRITARSVVFTYLPLDMQSTLGFTP